MSTVFAFLRTLNENNSKQWMDAHRDDYKRCKEIRIDQIDAIYDRLSAHDDTFTNADPSQGIERINNNLLYHPEKPTYKDHFWATIQWEKDFWLYIKAWLNHSFIGGWAHNIESNILKKIRKKIDTHWDELMGIIKEDAFVSFYGWLPEDENALKTSPRWYDSDHKHIELLRRKNFAVMHSITQKEIMSDSFVDIVEKAYCTIQPLLWFLHDATK